MGYAPVCAISTQQLECVVHIFASHRRRCVLSAFRQPEPPPRPPPFATMSLRMVNAAGSVCGVGRWRGGVSVVRVCNVWRRIAAECGRRRSVAGARSESRLQESAWAPFCPPEISPAAAGGCSMFRIFAGADKASFSGQPGPGCSYVAGGTIGNSVAVVAGEQ